MFHDRLDAGSRLAPELLRYKGRRDTLILAIPRGGLPIGRVLASELGLPLDVILTKKIGHPDNPEFAIGAVSLSSATVDTALVEREGIPGGYIDLEIARIRESLLRRYRIYRGTAQPPRISERTIILTDDGAATGRTLLAAIDLLKGQGAARIVVALPVAPPDTVEVLRRAADEVICLEQPEEFMAIGQFYRDFSQVADEDASAILKGEVVAARRGGASGGAI